MSIGAYRSGRQFLSRQRAQAEQKKLKAEAAGRSVLTSEGRKARRVLIRRRRRRADKPAKQAC
jgi:hypothetical protein